MQVNDIYNILEEDKDFFLNKKDEFLKCVGNSSEFLSESSIRTIADKFYLSLFSFESNEKNIETLVKRLLKYKTDIKPELTNFLMNLVNEYLDYCIKNKKSVKNVKALLQLINYYISIIDKAYVAYLSKISKQIEKLSKEKSEANKELALSILSKLKEDKKSIRLISYYKEVPIICKTQIEKITDEFAVLEFDNCSVKAFYPEKNVYIKTDIIQKKIKATIINISPKEEKLTLGKFELTDLPQEKRKFVRVEPSENITVQLEKGNTKITGKLADISIGGVGIYTADIKDLEEDNIIKISFKLPSIDFQVNLHGQIVYILDMDGMYRLGIKYSPDVITEEKISDYVINRQFEILKELKS